MIRTTALPIAKSLLANLKFEDVAKFADATAKVVVVVDKHAGKVLPVARAIAKATGFGKASPPDAPAAELLPDTAFEFVDGPVVPDAGAFDWMNGFDYGSLETLAGGW